MAYGCAGSSPAFRTKISKGPLRAFFYVFCNAVDACDTGAELCPLVCKSMATVALAYWVVTPVIAQPLMVLIEDLRSKHHS